VRANTWLIATEWYVTWDLARRLINPFAASDPWWQNCLCIGGLGQQSATPLPVTLPRGNHGLACRENSIPLSAVGFAICAEQQTYLLAHRFTLGGYKGSSAALVAYETTWEKISLLIPSVRSVVVAGGEEVRSGDLTFHYRGRANSQVIT
jgi:hypothetical protein